jgi:hypothetical protein
MKKPVTRTGSELMQSGLSTLQTITDDVRLYVLPTAVCAVDAVEHFCVDKQVFDDGPILLANLQRIVSVGLTRVRLYPNSFGQVKVLVNRATSAVVEAEEAGMNENTHYRIL